MRTSADNCRILPRVRSGPGAPRVLVADQHFESRFLLATLLVRAGCNVLEAADGPKVVEIFTSWRPQVIWLELYLPKLDGRETARRIKTMAAGNDTKIVGLTGYGIGQELVSCLQENFVAIVQKPFRITEFSRIMEECLGPRWKPWNSNAAGPGP